MKDFINIGSENDQKNLDGQISEKEIDKIKQRIGNINGNKKLSEENNSEISDISIIEEGYILSSRYKIQKLLGRGGMADVYLAIDINDNKEVAVKILKAELTNDKDFIKRFDTEAQAVAKLSHQSIVKIHDVGFEGKFRYIVFEYIEGISLKELIEKNGRLDYDVAVPIAIQIGLALGNAHKNGIIHRDIKPHNILITSDFKAKVTDFGIARTTTSNTMTLTGKNTMGSVHYFSPEQARGGIVGEQSDIYSLGVVLYEMLTGQLPFDGDTSVSIALKHVQVSPVPPYKINPEIPKGLSKIVIKCMQKSSDQRYKNAGELVDELDAFMIEPNGDYGYIQKYDDRKTSVISAVERDSNFGKLKEMEYVDKQKKKVRWKERAIVVIAIIAIVSILGGSAYYGIEWIKAQLTPPVVYYIVENFIGKNIDDVRSKLDRENINYEIFYEESDTVASGIIFYQSVQQGLEMRPGGASSITLRVSSGKDSVKISDYAGKNYRLVQNELTQIFGLKVKIVKELSEEHPQDNIIETIPSAGNEVPKGSEVTLVVSEGLVEVEIPDVLGKVRSEVYEILKENHLGIRSESSIAPIDLPDDQQFLIGIEPSPGTIVKALTKVIITFGSYEDYQNSILPKATPTPTPTPPPTPEESAAENTQEDNPED